MVDLDDWLPLVRPQLPGLPDFLGTEATREAAIEFCRRTKLLKAAFVVTTSPGQSDYNITNPGAVIPALQDGPCVVFGVDYCLSAPQGLVVDMVDEILRDDMALDPSSREVFRDERMDLVSGSPTAYYLDGSRALVLGPIPDAEENLTGRFIMRPSSDASALDDALWEDWRWVIAAGARAHLRRHYSAWMEPGLLEQDDNLFQDGIGHANYRRARGQTRHRLRVPGHYF